MMSYMICKSDEEREYEALSNLKEVKDRWDSAKKSAAEAKYIENLIHKDFISHIRNLETIWNYRLSIIKDAVAEADKTKKKERKNVSIIEAYLKEDFIEEYTGDVKITKIVNGGYEDYYYMIYFNIYGLTYAIQIPNRHAINMDNASYAHYGKFVFCVCPSDSYIKVLFEEWSEKGLANKIKEYLENEFGTSTIKV